MEEARQHPPLARENKLYAVVFAAGLLALFVGLCLQLALGGHFLLFGMITFGLTRVTTEAWQLYRPQLFERPRRKAASIFSIVAWTIILALVMLYVRPTI